MIGNSGLADIRLPHDSVAARHAELVVTDDGHFYLTDCGSGQGTWRQVPGEAGGDGWAPLRQDFVAADEVIRLGRHRCSLGQLLNRPAAPAAGDGPPAARAPGPEPEGERAARPKGPVERDPLTGQIVRKRG